MVKKKKEEQTENNGEEVQDEEKEQSDLQKFVATALRQPRGGIYEQLLSQFLAQAVLVTDPLKRIKIVCEAALYAQKEREDLAIAFEIIEVLNAVANALLNSSSQRIQGIIGEVVSVSWGFSPTEENYEKYVRPWFTCLVSYYPMLLRHHVEFERRNSYEPPRIKRIITDPLWDWFFDATSCLSAEGYNAMRNAFAAWAIPQVQLYLAELTQVVNPNVYAEVLGLYTRNSKKSYAEKVKETSKPPEGPKDET